MYKMILKKIRVNYSIIGNFVDFLIQNEQRIKNMMQDYEIQTKVDTLPDGREVKNLLFTTHLKRIMFATARIDFTYSLPTPTTSFDETYQEARSFFNLLGEIFPEVVGNRIAIVLNSFIENSNNQAIISMTEFMGLTSSFGSCNELSFKINTPKQKKEIINSVLNVDMGSATNNKTKEQIPVLLISFDANTLANNQVNRFYATNFEHDFADLIDEIKNRTIEMEKFA